MNALEKIHFLQKKINDDRKFPYQYLYIVVHKMDVNALQTQETFDVFAVIANIKKVRMILTFDNFRYLTLLDPMTSEKLKLIHYNYNTEITNYEEMRFEENIMKTKYENEYKSLCYIYKSLTQNQKDILKLLAAWQLENEKKSGISQAELLELCIDEMILRNDEQLRENLFELLDHKVIKEKKQGHRKNSFFMTYDDKTLKRIVQDNL